MRETHCPPPLHALYCRNSTETIHLRTQLLEKHPVSRFTHLQAVAAPGHSVGLYIKPYG
ncbi:hypothetical protein JZ751_004601 [Albula glossodonta]|uniref:Uncharacterized protein n=1 Tax=Albula glossodonta TaxID=121402 RepID=A0A8T2MLA0_9TELE|nr:hypothetical protein JZ751_010658 [Albula glossodonta]KAG9335472.1 hypothetical protein JZ751_004601 [Albula glossodonta]